MNTDMEDMLRSGMERFTAQVPAPRGLAVRAARARGRRRLTAVAAAAGTAAAVTAATVIAVIGGTTLAPARSGHDLAQARTAAYVVRRVENALAGTNLVFQAYTGGNNGPSMTWAYGRQSRWVEFTGRHCGHYLVPSGDCTNHGGSVRYLAEGTAMVHGKLTGIYLTYFNREYVLSRVFQPAGSACSTSAALSMGGPPAVDYHWRAFISASLACGAASVTGHVRINGVETIRITGKPVTENLSKGYSRVIKEKKARVLWTLYVNPRTYLPVRISGATETFGGSYGFQRSWSVSDVRWLPPTRANIARTLITIPTGFRQVSFKADA